MTIPKEVRIGLLATISLLVFFTGFYLLKGSNLFSSEKEYDLFYEKVDGLQKAANVQVRGLNVGRVSDIQLVDNKGVKVVISVSKKIEVPQGTVAQLASADLLGTKIIRLDLGNGPGLVAPGSSLPSNIEGGVLDNISTEISPLMRSVQAVVATLDTVLLGVNEIVNDQNRKEIAGSIASLHTTANNFASLSESLKKESGEISSIIHNANSVTANLSKSNENIQHIVSNTANITDQLSKAPIQATFKDLQATTAQLQGIMDKINSNQGSLGMMVNDKSLYNNLAASLNSLNELMADLKKHPSRYVNISVFGGKRKD